MPEKCPFGAAVGLMPTVVNSNAQAGDISSALCMSGAGAGSASPEARPADPALHLVPHLDPNGDILWRAFLASPFAAAWFYEYFACSSALGPLEMDEISPLVGAELQFPGWLLLSLLLKARGKERTLFLPSLSAVRKGGEVAD